MLMINKRLAQVHRITWRVLVDGRLVHVRVYGDDSHTNVVGYYQQAWQPLQVASCLRARAALMSKLDKLLTECSNNQLLLLGGDFDTDLPPASPNIGDAASPHAGFPLSSFFFSFVLKLSIMTRIFCSISINRDDDISILFKRLPLFSFPNFCTLKELQTLHVDGPIIFLELAHQGRSVRKVVSPLLTGIDRRLGIIVKLDWRSI